jgi:hypothetical protein
MDFKLTHGTYRNCTIKVHKYLNDRPALIIYYDDKVLLKASINMPEITIPEDYICIKNWAENEGILEALIENNIIEPTKYVIPSGHIMVPVCKLLKKD